MGIFKDSIKKIVNETDQIEADFIEKLAQKIIGYIKDSIEKNASLGAFKCTGDTRLISGYCSLKQAINGKIIVHHIGNYRGGRAPYSVPESAEYGLHTSNRYFHRISVSYADNDIDREITITSREQRLRARLEELSALDEIKIKSFLLITYERKDPDDPDTEDCYQEIFENENITDSPPTGCSVHIGILYKYEFEF